MMSGMLQMSGTVLQMLLAALLVVSVTGCSFFGVRGPGALPDPPPPPEYVHCTTSDTLPSLDALGGAGALAAAVGGTIIENTSDSGSPQHFTKYYMLPLVAIGIVYFVSASSGTHKIEQCQVAKDHSLPPVQ